MSYVSGNITTVSSGTILPAQHGISGSHDGQRTVLAVVTEAAATITHIYERFTTTDGGFTPVASYTAHSCTLWLFEKVCGPAEPQIYEVHFTPAPTVFPFISILTDFITTGDPIAAHAFADSPSGTSLTLPSVQAANGDDLYTVVWNDPAVASGQLRPQAPLNTSGNSLSSGFPTYYFEESREVWQSSDPTGTRQYAVASGSHQRAIGAIMLVGGAAPSGGGWGVGQIRMGAN